MSFSSFKKESQKWYQQSINFKENNSFFFLQKQDFFITGCFIKYLFQLQTLKMLQSSNNSDENSQSQNKIEDKDQDMMSVQEQLPNFNEDQTKIKKSTTKLCIGIIILLISLFGFLIFLTSSQLKDKNTGQQKEIVEIPNTFKDQEIKEQNGIPEKPQQSNNLLKYSQEKVEDPNLANPQQKCFDCSLLLKQTKFQLESLYNENNLLLCSHLNIHDQHDPQKNTLYYSTPYDIFLLYCGQNNDNQNHVVKNQNIQKWNKNREIIEWAKINLKKGDNVFVDGTKQLNLLEMIILSHLVGRQGKVYVKDLKNSCIHTNFKFYNITNVFSSSNYQSVQYNYYVGKIANSLPYKIDQYILNGKIKAFVYSQNPTNLKLLSSSFLIQRYSVNKEICTLPKIDNQLTTEGYYFLQRANREGIEVGHHLAKAIYSPVPQIVKKNYQNYKKKIIKQVQRKLDLLLNVDKTCGCSNPYFQRIAQKNELLTLYGNTLFNSNIQQIVDWQKVREPIQWVRQRAKQNSKVYYQVVQQPNLFNVIQISYLIRDGQLILSCEGIFCSRIRQQMEYYKITNIKLMSEKVQSLILQDTEQPFLITNNITLINTIINSNLKILEKAQVLIYLNEKKQSLKLLGKLLGYYELKKIIVENQICQGFKYQNFFWSSKIISGFYEVLLNKRYIFMFWGGEPQTVPFRRKHLMQEIIQNSKVQGKIINNKLFLLMQKENFPIHKAYHLLSPVHKSDYARSYLMHTYGGGYADVKHLHFDWNPFFQEFQNSPQIFAFGYSQKNRYDVACNNQHGPPNCNIILDQYKQMIGNCLYMYRKQTKASLHIMNWIHQILDRRYDSILRNPPKVPRDQLGLRFTLNGVTEISRYPLRWAQINGQIRSRVCHEDKDRYRLNMPFVIIQDYQISS